MSAVCLFTFSGDEAAEWSADATQSSDQTGPHHGSQGEHAELWRRQAAHRPAVCRTVRQHHQWSPVPTPITTSTGNQSPVHGDPASGASHQFTPVVVRPWITTGRWYQQIRSVITDTGLRGSSPATVTSQSGGTTCHQSPGIDHQSPPAPLLPRLALTRLGRPHAGAHTVTRCLGCSQNPSSFNVLLC